MKERIIQIFVFSAVSVLFLGSRVLVAQAQGAEDSNIQFQTIMVFGEQQYGAAAAIDASNQQSFSRIYNTDFPFRALGLEWREKNGPPTDGLKIALRVLQNSQWSAWVDIKEEEPDMPDFAIEDYNAGQRFSDLIFITGEKIQLKIQADNATTDWQSLISFLSLTYFGEKQEASFPGVVKRQLPLTLQQTGSSLLILARNQWINGEIDDGTRLTTWPEEYVEPQKFILHHTGTIVKDRNSDGIITAADYLLIVRAIYQWQAVRKGWADTGYNYIIDPLGNIYEGRFGGDGVVAGHTIRTSAECIRHKGALAGYNKGTIGIALLGNFDEETPTNAAQSALAELIAAKANEFGIAPNGSGFFVDRDLPNIFVHKEVSCTTCPGRNLMNIVEETRTKAQARYEQLQKQPKYYRAELLSTSHQTFSLKKEEAKTVTVEFRNEGNATWRNYTREPVYLAIETVKQKLARLDTIGLAGLRIAVDESEDTKETAPLPLIFAPSPPVLPYLTAKLTSPNVKPGEMGRFALSLQRPAMQVSEKKNYLLALGNKGWLPDSGVSITAIATDLDYAAQLQQYAWPTETWAVTTTLVEIKIQNIGAKTWQQGEVLLNIYQPDKKDRKSVFYENSWQNKSVISVFLEKEAPSLGFATFKFSIKAPGPGLYQSNFYLSRQVSVPGYPEVILGEEKIPGSDFEITTTVKAPYSAAVKSQSIPLSIKRNKTAMVMLTLENTGAVTWDKNFVLQGAAPHGKISAFRDKSWRSAKIIEKLDGEVLPSQAVTFLFKLKAPAKKGAYTQIFQLAQKKEVLYIDDQKEWKVQIKVE